MKYRYVQRRQELIMTDVVPRQELSMPNRFNLEAESAGEP